MSSIQLAFRRVVIARATGDDLPGIYDLVTDLEAGLNGPVRGFTPGVPEVASSLSRDVDLFVARRTSDQTALGVVLIYGRDGTGTRASIGGVFHPSVWRSEFR